jgi:hypothetical protein
MPGPNLSTDILTRTVRIEPQSRQAAVFKPQLPKRSGLPFESSQEFEPLSPKTVTRRSDYYGRG